MANHPIDSLNYAIRQRLRSDSDIAAAGVYYGRISDQDELPALVINRSPAKDNGVLSGLAWWELDYSLVWVAEEKDGMAALSLAYPLAQATYEKLDGGTQATRKQAQDALNATLNPLGYRVMLPVAAADIPEDSDTINNVERWSVGHRIRLRIQAI